MADQKITELLDYTPAIDTDIVPIVDMTAVATKKITWANIKATLKTYFDTIYLPKTLVATLAGDQATGANVTPVDLTGLVFNYEANSKYRIWFSGNVSPTASTTGCGFQFNLSSAVTSIGISFYHQLATTGTLIAGNSIANDASAVVTTGMPANGGLYPIVGNGLLITTANAGTAQLRFRSETTAVTTVKAGFTLVVEKIA